MLHIPLTNLLLLGTKQEPYKKAHLFTKNIGRIFWKKFRRKDQQAEKDKTERVAGLSRRTWEKIAKWNQMTALRFQTGGEDIRHPGPPFGGKNEEWRKEEERTAQQIKTSFSLASSRLLFYFPFFTYPVYFSFIQMINYTLNLLLQLDIQSTSPVRHSLCFSS